jgi:hypothetical protein
MLLLEADDIKVSKFNPFLEGTGIDVLGLGDEDVV